MSDEAILKKALEKVHNSGLMPKGACEYDDVHIKESAVHLHCTIHKNWTVVDSVDDILFDETFANAMRTTTMATTITTEGGITFTPAVPVAPVVPPVVSCKSINPKTISSVLLVNFPSGIIGSPLSVTQLSQGLQDSLCL